MTTISRAIGSRLARFLSKPLPGYRRLDTVSIEDVARVLQPGDIVLVEGNSRVSIAVKYLTQSSWSHACLYVGNAGDSSETKVLLEAELNNGVQLVSLEHYANFNLRICRPVGIAAEDIDRLISFAKAKLGHRYDQKNVVDLMRYLIQKPAVPNRYRRAMISFGSGEPTKAICSTLIAESFQSIGYPILPRRGAENDQQQSENSVGTEADAGKLREVEGINGEVPLYYRRHFTHFTPRDFDLSPYFSVIKPTILSGFDYRNLSWQSELPNSELPNSEQVD